MISKIRARQSTRIFELYTATAAQTHGAQSRDREVARTKTCKDEGPNPVRPDTRVALVPACDWRPRTWQRVECRAHQVHVPRTHNTQQPRVHGQQQRKGDRKRKWHELGPTLHEMQDFALTERVSLASTSGECPSSGSSTQDTA